MNKNNMLTIDGLNLKIKDKKILANISFSIGSGEVLSLLGHNGSGKTSILKTIMGLYKGEGSIIFKGEDINDKEIWDRAKLGIAYIMQEIPEYSGINIETYMKGVLGKSYDEVKIREYFERFGLAFDLYKNRVFDSKLSGGEKKKIEIVLTFLMNKDLYLLDEVETGLDVTSRNIFKDMILEEIKKGKSFILVSHYEDLIKISNNSILLCNGKIQETGNVNDIFKKYAGECVDCDLQNNCR